MPRHAVWGLLLLATALPAQQYPFITVAHSPKNIEQILEDRQGRLWISTHDDVLCFDGARFFSLHEFGVPPIFSDSLTEDDEGGILIAWQGGLYRFYQGRLEQVLSGPYVVDAIGVAPGVLLATAERDLATETALLYRIRRIRGKWQAEQITGWNIGQALTRDRSGAVLAACQGGWCEMPARLIEDWTPERPGHPLFHKSPSDFQRILKDRLGCLWFRSMEGVAYQCPGDLHPIPLPASVAGRNVWFGERESDDGSMLFASAGSLAAGRPGSFQTVSPANGLPAEVVTCAVRAHDGSIWLGTLSGLYRFPFPFRMTYWKSRNGLIWSFARWGGAMLAGTSAGIARLSQDGEWNVLRGSRQFGSIGSLLAAPDGSVYAAVSREAVIRLRPDGSLSARTPPQQGGQAGALARASDGSIWLAGSGFYRVVQKGRTISLAPENPAGKTPSESFIASGPAGGLWGCFAGNVIRRDSGNWQTVARDGLPQSQCRSLAFPAGGDVWAGFTSGFALVHPTAAGPAAIRQFSSGGEIGDAVSYSFAADARGWMWRGSQDGVYVADASQSRAGVWLHLNDTDGLTDLDVNHGSLFSDPDGSVWWAAAASIVHFFPPSDLVHPASPPPVFLSSFSLDGGPPQLAEALPEFPGKKVTAHLGSLQFQGRNAVRVRYRVLPEEKEWRESGGLEVNLGSLPWGSHTLEIQSRFSMGQWSPTWSRQLVVLRPWWFSWPALLAFAGIGCGGAAGGVTWHRKLKARAKTALPDLADWRMAVLSPESQLAGTTLDRRFEVLGLVARGGFATVLKGRDLRHAGRLCAIKIFRREVVDEEWLAHRFQQEVSALEQIRHPSVVSIFGHGATPNGAPYLAMEFIEGGTLRDLLDAGALPLERTASLLGQVAAALEQIHARGIYHRDLKPENLMLRTGARAGEELVLIDFSIAIVKEPDQTIHGLSRAAGTIYYMAPEQAVGFATPASDVYSLAKIVLEMFTGKRLSTLLPHASMDLPDRVRELVRGLPIPLSTESVDLLGAALEFDPSRRPQQATVFAQPIVRDLAAAPSGLSTNRGLSPKGAAPGAN